jgi:hypothetical protein
MGKLLWNLDAAMGGMTVGDSFFVPCVSCQPAMTTLIQMGRQYGYEVKVRLRFENYVKGVRVWRVA